MATKGICKVCTCFYEAPTSHKDLCIKHYLERYPASEKEKYYKKYYNKLKV